MGVFEIIGTLFLAAGCLFSLTGSLGVLRLPDFYSRLHPAGKTDAFAQLLILTGLALFSAQKLLELALAEEGEHGMAMVGELNIMLKLLLIGVLILVTAPTATHAIAKAARLDRFTKIPVEADPGASRIEDIVVAGDVREQLHEEEGPLLDVREDEQPAEALDAKRSSETQSSEDD
jgi:multicomponent Na+:H+ antiporter subunit G